MEKVNVTIKTKNLELTDSLVFLVNSKMERLQRFIKVLQGNNPQIHVEIEKESRHHKKGDVFKAEAIIHLPGKPLIARAHGEDLHKLITEVKEELENEIRKYKTKTVELPRRKYRKEMQENPEM